MNITKKIIAIAEIIMLLFLTACNENSDSIKNDIQVKQNKVSEITESNFEYKLSEKTVFDNSVISCSKLVDQYKDGFVFTGSSSNTGTDFIVLSGKSGGQTETSSISFDTAQTDVISVKKKDDTVYFLSGSAGKGSITSYDQSGNQIERTELDFPPQDFVVGDKIYVLNSFGYSFSSKIEVYSDKLAHEESIDITLEEDGKTLDPYKIAVSLQNEIYCLFTDKNKLSDTKVMSVSDNNKIICNSVDDMNSVDDIFINSKGTIILVGKEEGKYLVDELDKNGDIVSMSEIQNCDEVYGITGSDKIIFRSSDGISAFYDDKPELIIRSDDFKDNSIIACCMEADGCTVYLSSIFGEYNAVFITDQNNKIVSEVKVDMINDCFVENDKVYIDGIFEGKHTLKIYDNGNTADTGIEFDDEERASNIIGVLPSGEIIIYNGDKNNFTFYSDTFEKISSKNTNISVICFFKSNDSLYCSDSKNIYRFNEKYETEKINVDINGFGNIMGFSSGNDEYEFLFSVSGGLYGYNKSESTVTLLVDYNKEVLSNIESILMLKDKSILIQNHFSVYQAKKIEKKSGEDSEKQKLILAYENTNRPGMNTLKETVKKFNKESGKYQIEMKCYSLTENADAESLFSLDVVSGNIPDIVTSNVLSENIVTFLKDDSFADMNQYIEKDNQISRDMFYSSVLDAFTYNDKLYALPLVISLNTCYSPADTKFENCSQLIDYISNTYSSDEYFTESGNDLSEIYLSEKLDLINRKFNLSETDLNKIISFLRKYCDEFKGMDFDFSGEKTVCPQLWISSLRYFCNYLNSTEYESESGLSGELGYPGNKGLVTPDMSLSIMEKCENKDAAWEFVKLCCNSIGDNPSEELYSIKSLNTYSEAPRDIIEQFDSVMEGNMINPVLYQKLSYMIFNEIRQNPDVSDEELSKSIYNKMKLYFSEIE